MAGKDALVTGYAEALFAIAEAEGAVDKVEDELFGFAKALETNRELREAMTDPALPGDRKKAVVRDLLGERANPQTVNALDFLIDQGRAREIEKILEQFAEVAAARRRSALAEVRSAVALDDAQLAGLQEALTRATGRQVEVRPVVDPSVIGGIVTRIGDEVIDGSVRTRLREAREQLGSR